MNSEMAKALLGMVIVVFWLLLPGLSRAQVAEGRLSGTIKGPSGDVIPNAQVSVRNVATGQSTQTQTDSKGVYNVPHVAPGDDEVSVSAEGFSAKTTKVTIAAEAAEELNLVLTSAPSPAAGPSLRDLGFSPSQAQGSAQYQAMLDRRSHMLQLHQRLGLITTAPLVATVVTGPGAKGHHGMPGSPSGRELHAALGASTAALYFTSAYFAIRAPKVPDTSARGPIRLHKALA
jgi:carboxypeptidase family protein